MNKKILIMGILNVTPDSFSDGGKFNTPIKALKRAKQMIKEGVDIIDVGGESTRPGSNAISVEEELSRVIPVIKKIHSEISAVPISVDTYKSKVANQALKVGATMVNSLGGFKFDPKMVKVIKDYNCKIIIYHIKGIPETMQKGKIIYADVVKEICQFFDTQIKLGLKTGLKKEQFLLDPGIGFGKAINHNLEIIKKLREFKKFNLPIVISSSRKGHLGLLLKEKLNLKEVPSPAERLEASLAETAIAVLNGVNIIRTHDVWQTKKFITVFNEIR